MKSLKIVLTLTAILSCLSLNAAKITIKAVPTYENCSIYLNGDQADTKGYHVEFKKVDAKEWQKAYQLVNSSNNKTMRGSIIGLKENTHYSVRLVKYVKETSWIIFEKTVAKTLASTSFKTWNSKPPIKKVINISKIAPKGGPIMITESGTADGWIKYITDKNYVVRGGNIEENAILINKAKYIILENLTIKGGRVNSIKALYSQHIRIINCDISGYGRVGKQDISKDGKFYLPNGKFVNYDAGVSIYKSGNLTVERCFIHDPRNTANSWFYSHPAGPNAVYVKATGGIVIRYNDFIGSDKHRWNDCIEGSGNGIIDGGFHRDSDIYGNILAFGNDDGIELDGGQKNVRFYDNKIEGFLCGVSTAANLQGPSYIFRNLVLNLEDETGAVGSIIKNGGGTTFSKGRSFFFNNIFYGQGAGISGVGFGKDKDRARFKATSRNNIICTTGLPIRDRIMDKDNDFDYDLLYSFGNTKAEIAAIAGSEKHAIFANPQFVNPKIADFKLKSSSPAIGTGEKLNNFDPSNTPSMGTGYEMHPNRPIPVRISAQQVNLKASICSKTSDTTKLILSVNKSGFTSGFKILKNIAFDWLQVSPSSGKIVSGTKTELSVKADATKIKKVGKYKGAFIVKLDSGYSIPVTVYIQARNNRFRKTIEADATNNKHSFKKTNDTTASNDNCLWLIADKEREVGDKFLEYEIEVPKTGDYYLFAKVKSPAPVGMHDSYFLSVNKGKVDAHHIKSGQSWTWSVRVKDLGKGKIILKKGKNIIRIYPRESLYIDQLEISSDPAPFEN